MVLPHRQWQPAFPASEQVAKPAVAIPIRVQGDVFFPQNLKRVVLALHLARYHRPARFRQLRRRGFTPAAPQSRISSAAAVTSGGTGQERPDRYKRKIMSRNVERATPVIREISPIGTAQPGTIVWI